MNCSLHCVHSCLSVSRGVVHPGLRSISWQEMDSFITSLSHNLLCPTFIPHCQTLIMVIRFAEYFSSPPIILYIFILYTFAPSVFHLLPRDETIACDVVSGQFPYCSFLLMIICGNAAWCIVTGIVWKPAPVRARAKQIPWGISCGYSTGSLMCVQDSVAGDACGLCVAAVMQAGA